MVKQYTVKHVRDWQPRQFIRDGGEIIGFMIDVELNLGSFAITQQLDVWEFLTEPQREAIQSFYNTVDKRLTNHYVEE